MEMIEFYFNPPTNYQVLAPLRNENVVTTTQATVVGTKEILQTSSEGTYKLLNLVHRIQKMKNKYILKTIQIY